jgi:hypothetical protein
MSSSGMLRLMALVRTDVSEELRASIFRVTRIGELGKTLDITTNRHTLRRNVYVLRRLLVTASLIPSSPILVNLMMEAIGSSEMSVITRATRRISSEDGIVHKTTTSSIWFRNCAWLCIRRNTPFCYCNFFIKFCISA